MSRPIKRTTPMPTTHTYRQAAEIAGQTSMCNAARVLGISLTTVRRAMKKHGVPIRRPGNFTKLEYATLPANGWAA